MVSDAANVISSREKMRNETSKILSNIDEVASSLKLVTRQQPSPINAELAEDNAPIEALLKDANELLLSREDELRQLAALQTELEEAEHRAKKRRTIGIIVGAIIVGVLIVSNFR